jgi:ankyrin repeat protein
MKCHIIDKNSFDDYLKSLFLFTLSSSIDLVLVGIQLGRTKVFLRHHAFNALESLRSQKQRDSATKIQAMYRMHFYKAVFERICISTLFLQCCFRSYKARKQLQYLRKSQKAIIIQSAWRGFAKYSAYSTILFVTCWCQRVHRGNVARCRVHNLLSEKMAVKIQSWWRMVDERTRLKTIQNIALNLQQLYRSKKARKILGRLRAEAKDVFRISRERDLLKEEIAAWKAKEESWKRAMKLLKPQNELPGSNEEFQRLLTEAKKKDEELIKLKDATRRMKEELRKEKVDVSHSSDSINEVEILRSELVRKDHEIRVLKVKVKGLQDTIDRKEHYMFTSNRGLEPTPEKDGSCSLLDFEPTAITPNTKSTIPNELNDSWSPASTTICPRSLNFDTPIHTAIRAADDDALSVAVTTSGDIANEINRGGRDGKSPLHLAVLNSNVASAKYLLLNHSVANTQDDDGNTPLHYAESSEMVKILLEIGKANPNIPNEAGICALHVAVRRRDLESVRLLIQYHANVNVADNNMNWWTPLHLISQPMNFERSGAETHFSTIEIAQVLLEAQRPHSAEVDYQDKDGNTPLHHAAVLSSYFAGDLMSLLLKKKAKPDIQNNRGQTVLHLVLHNVNLRKFDFYNDLVQLIIFHGAATIKIPSLSGCTPLHLALYHQDLKNAIQLVENGAELQHPWVKPPRWQAHWSESNSTSDVYPLEMIDDDDLRYSLVTSIKSKQKHAPLRSNCMFCKRKVGTFAARPKNCHHCGSLVCVSCAPNKLSRSFFPSYCDISREEERVCIPCETVLVSRKRDENIVGREVYAIHLKQEDVSFLDMDASHLGDGSLPQLQIEM